MSGNAPSLPPAYEIQDGMRRFFEAAGLLPLIPWAFVSSGLLVAGTACAALAARPEWAPGTPAIAALMGMWPLSGIGLLLVWVVALSGTVRGPWRRALAGIGLGFVAALGVTVATCAGFGRVFGAGLGATLLGGCAAILAAGAAAGWASLRYRASPAGVVASAGWVASAGLLPVLVLALVRWAP